MYHWYDSSKNEVSPDHEKCYAEHFSQQHGSGSLQVSPCEQAVNFVFYTGVLKECRDAT